MGSGKGGIIRGNAKKMADMENYENAEGLEMSWATEAMGFADRHWDLLTGLQDAKKMKVTRWDCVRVDSRYYFLILSSLSSTNLC
mmetsp:Transcript_40936/g.162117  ORF Transcript_40936/g.162117 Transcript_40936/m.162117 type:complete len:85 (+) Transcript_40936:361-615(+)